MSPQLQQVLLLGAGMFCLGLIGFLTRRNIILMFLSVELMLSGVATNFIAFGYHHGHYGGQVMATLVLTVASCEAALALALVVTLYRRIPTLDIERWSALNESEDGKASLQANIETTDEDEDSNSDKQDDYPRLTPAGRDPLTDPIPQRLSSELNPQKA